MDPEPPLPRPTLVAGSRSSSRASSRGRSIASSGLTSRSTSPAQRPDTFAPDPSAGPSSLPLFRADRSASRDAAASSSYNGTRHRSTAHARTRHAADASDLIVISSDSSEDGNDDDDDGFVAQWPTDPVIRPPPADFFEVAGVRRAQPSPSVPRDGLFSPPPLAGRPAEPVLLAGGSAGRRAGVSVDPRTGDFLTRPMSIVRHTDSAAYSDPDGSFTLVSAQTAPPPPPPPPPRSDHPITDQRLRSSKLAMPTKSPPRSKPPPIEHPLLSTYTCPICFDAPKNLCVTPCGHFFCGECLFQALKTQAVQRGAMEEEASLFHFGGLFSSFVPAAAFGAASGGGGPLNPAATDHGGGGPTGPSPGAGHGRGGGGAGSSRGGSTNGGRGRSKPDPLAGQCPVCRAKIKGAFNGREKNGIVGLRLTMGKPVNDPRQENGQMKTNRAAEAAEASSGSESDDEEETVLPTSRELEAVTEGDIDQIDAAGDSPRAARRRQRSVNNNASATITGRSPTAPESGSQTRKRRRNASDTSAT
ncbi:E3 ubiquitin-protein ligase complex SLX5-SLX8 subunit SLX8 [Pseudozyma hubeiensis]|nr:E3 ubiquitin-protein ligase complex SLX5-SLX8 subunit SLX8 [Pseudozyma hubeiensis]